MATLLSDKIVRAMKTRDHDRIERDSREKGFAVRVWPSGAKSFILVTTNNAGRKVMVSLGSFPAMTVSGARAKAAEIKSGLRLDGRNPVADRRAARNAPTVEKMCEKFKTEYMHRLRPNTKDGYTRAIDKVIIPELGNIKVANLAFEDVSALHRKLTSTRGPFSANRAIAPLRKMCNLAKRWLWLTANPCEGLEQNRELPRHRYLSADEIARLSIALAEHDDKQAANIIRLLLTTGSRRNEVQSMRWADLDLTTGTWVKPSSHTKSKRDHRVPLSAPARQLLAGLRSSADEDAVYVFPGTGETGHRVELKKDWAAICKAAKIKGARMHDLRHTFASVLVSSGMTLPVIGALLGHTQPATTARYSHLFDDPLRAATERAGAVITSGGKSGAEVVQLKGRAG